MSTATSRRSETPDMVDDPAVAGRSDAGTGCYRRVGPLPDARPDREGSLHGPAGSRSEEAPTWPVAIAPAHCQPNQQPVGSAGDPQLVSPAQHAAALSYVRRIPNLAQQTYAADHLAWCLAGRPAGGQPRLGGYGLSLAAGEHLRATVEALLVLPPRKAPARRRRR